MVQAWTTQKRAGGLVFPRLHNPTINRVWETLVTIGAFYLWAMEQPYQ